MSKSKTKVSTDPQLEGGNAPGQNFDENSASPQDALMTSGAAAGALETNSPNTPESETGAGTDAFKSVPAEVPSELFTASLEEFKAKFPLTGALIERWHARSPDVQPTALRIVSQRDGFWRAGKQHSRAAVDHQLTDFRMPEQIEQLLAEPMLTVELV